MKNRLNWLLPVLLMAILPMQGRAQTASLSIESGFKDIKAGEEKELVINLTNSGEITLVQFDLRLPSGLSLKVEDDDYVYDIAGRTSWKNHSLSANAQADGSVRFLLASSKNATLTGTSGPIITMTVVATASFKGGTITLENILMVTPAEKEIKQGTYSYAVGQSDPDPGPGPTPGSGDAYISYEPFAIQAGQEKEMVIDLTNPGDEITLVQFDMHLPAGLSLKKIGSDYDYDMAGRTDWRRHSLDLHQLNDGSIRFLLSSTSNTAISGTEGAIIKVTIVAGNDYAGGIVTLENILMVTPDEKEIKQGNYPPNAETTLLAKEQPFVMVAGQEKELVIDLQNPSDDVTLVQFDLRLPKGLTLKKDGGEYVYDMCERTDWRRHSLDLSPLTDGSIRVLLSSTSNTVIKDRQGALLKMTLVADGTFAGGNITLANILLVTPAEKEIKPGDVTISTIAPASATLTIESLSLSSNGEARMVVGLSNPADQITLVQFDLRLPSGLTLKKADDDYDFELMLDRTTTRKHSIDANPMGDIVRFLVSSTSSAAFSGTEGPILKMTFVADPSFKADAAVTLENILLVTPGEKEIRPENVSAKVGKEGDVNTDGVIDVADIATIISVMADGGATKLQYDVNDDGTVDVADIATTISIMAQN